LSFCIKFFYFIYLDDGGIRVLLKVTVYLPTRQGIPDHHFLLKGKEITEGETEKMDAYTNKEAFSDGVKTQKYSKKTAMYNNVEDVENNMKKLHSFILNIKFPL
jgi:hypothetical protein